MPKEKKNIKEEIVRKIMDASLRRPMRVISVGRRLENLNGDVRFFHTREGQFYLMPISHMQALFPHERTANIAASAMYENPSSLDAFFRKQKKQALYVERRGRAVAAVVSRDIVKTTLARKGKVLPASEESADDLSLHGSSEKQLSVEEIIGKLKFIIQTSVAPVNLATISTLSYRDRIQEGEMFPVRISAHREFLFAVLPEHGRKVFPANSPIEIKISALPTGSTRIKALFAGKGDHISALEAHTRKPLVMIVTEAAVRSALEANRYINDVQSPTPAQREVLKRIFEEAGNQKIVFRVSREGELTVQVTPEPASP